MKHPTETQLNEYIDNVLESTAQARISVHLTTCADCRGRLASLETVFQALATLPEEKLERDLTPAVLHALPGSLSGLIGRLAFAIQAGVSLGVLLIFAPSMAGRIAGIVQRVSHGIARPEIKLPTPVEVYSYLPVIRLPNPPELTLPIAITHANLPIWFILGIAAALLFVVGNFSLIINSSSESKK
jgi:hypothetical protein